GWNGNNVDNCSPSPGCHPGTTAAGGTPTTAIVRQFDLGLGGPLVRDRAWFFGSVRRADLEAGISRTPDNIRYLRMFYPNVDLFTNITKSCQPYAKVTTKLNDSHQLAGFYQLDRLKATGDREYDYSRATVYSTGGGLYGGKLTSVWGQRMTTTFVVAYNNKGGSDASTFADYNGSGPDTIIHASPFQNGARIVGNGRLVEGGNADGKGPGGPGGSESLSPSSLWTIRGDLTYFKDGFAGSHELQTGFYGAPRSTYDTEQIFINNGFILEERSMVDPNDAAKGTVPFHRQ